MKPKLYCQEEADMLWKWEKYSLSVLHAVMYQMEGMIHNSTNIHFEIIGIISFHVNLRK